MNYKHVNMDNWDKFDWNCTYCHSRFYLSENTSPSYQDKEHQLCDSCVEKLCNYCKTCEKWYLKEEEDFVWNNVNEDYEVVSTKNCPSCNKKMIYK